MGPSRPRRKVGFELKVGERFFCIFIHWHQASGQAPRLRKAEKSWGRGSATAGARSFPTRDSSYKFLTAFLSPPTRSIHFHLHDQNQSASPQRRSACTGTRQQITCEYHFHRCALGGGVLVRSCCKARSMRLSSTTLALNSISFPISAEPARAFQLQAAFRPVP